MIDAEELNPDDELFLGKDALISDVHATDDIELASLSIVTDDTHNCVSNTNNQHSISINGEERIVRNMPSDRSIWIVSFLIIVGGCVIIFIMLFISTRSNTTDNGYTAGWIAVAGASFVFGGSGIPMKISSFSHPDTKLDPVLFACYSNLGILIFSMPVLIYILSIQQFIFYPWAILGAADIMIISFFAFNAVRALGYSIAPAIWTGIGMTTAFIWGSVVFYEQIEYLPYAILAIVLLITGVSLISLSQPTYNSKNTTTKSRKIALSDDIDEASSPSSSTHICNHLRFDVICTAVTPFLLCLLTGLCDGSLMVPFKLSLQTSDQNLLNVLSYIASFGIAELIVTPVIFGVYFVLVLRGISPKLYINTALFPGIFSGVLWACGNFCSVHATHYLGLRIGFPLTQTCLLITVMWGIFYFKEIDTHGISFRIKLGIGVLAIFTGSVLLGLFG